MAGATMRIPMSRRESDGEAGRPGPPESAADMIFGFLDDQIEESPESFSGESNNSDDIDFDEDSEEGNVENVEENKAFWESKEKLLKATLCRSSSIETKIRRATKEALSELKLEGNAGCACRKATAAATIGGCRDCLQGRLSDRLRVAGYNCSICKSKRKNPSQIFSGDHTYLEVVDNSESEKGEARVVIELNLRAEFEMARASEEYKRLIERLPEVFVGKSRRLKAAIKIVCSAAKKCMKDNKMHMGPWRTHKHMQAKWTGTLDIDKSIVTPIFQPAVFLNRPPKSRTSLLTFDLESLSGTVEVV